jgi:hypothetical protein
VTRRRVFRALVAFMLLVGLGVGVGGGTASAANYACGTLQTYFAGHDDWPGPATFNYGTQAHIITNGAGLCVTGAPNPNFNLAYVDLDQAVLNGGFMLAGYMIQNSNTNQCATPCFYAAFSRFGGNGSFMVNGNPAYGSTHEYTVQYNSASHTSILGPDYTPLFTTTFDLQADWTQGRHNIYRSETQAYGSDVPGSSSAPTDYQYLAVQQPLHACCQTSPPPLYYSGPSTSRYYTGPLVYNSFATYTK